MPTGFKKLLEETTETPDAKKVKRSARLLSSNEAKEDMVREMNDNIVTNDDVEYDNLNIKLEAPNNFLTRIPLMYNEINVS